MAFTGDERENLKSLLAFDSTVAEMFFGSRVIIVEGDTEFAAFTVVMDSDTVAFPIDGRPLLVRARGKWTIPILIRILQHFKVDFAALHDIDPPKTGDGKRVNGAYTANQAITDAIAAARTSKVKVIHRHSCPNFEQEHGMSLPDKDKPYETWKAVQNNTSIKQSVRRILDELVEPPVANSGDHQNDGQHFESKIKSWATANAQNLPAYTFT